MTDLEQSTGTTAGVSRYGPVRAWLMRYARRPEGVAAREMIFLFAVSGFLLLYGLVPFAGGDKVGLVGADEPRYAQIAREMLAVHESTCHELHTTGFPRSPRGEDIRNAWHCLVAGTVTPILHGKPWLEKPALYYWRAMGFFREFGVSDWAARLPSASATFFLIVLIFLHMRRFRPGGHLDAAIITASCAGIVSFARGASTDMQLAAPFCMGMLGWYAWYETDRKFWLIDIYFFVGAATLAKGPVAPFLALCILILFAGLRREWSLLRRSIWIPGLLLYFAMVLPWYIAVQLKNPNFYREFFFEHNLERFATNRFQHHQPIWYYLAVLVLGLMPWTVLGLRAMVDSCAMSLAEWRARRSPRHYLSHPRAGDAFPEFLVIWALFPILFFSFSGSKLPGYILPSLPPITILAADYLNRRQRNGLSCRLLWMHAACSAILVFVLTLSPQHMWYGTLVPSASWLTAATIAALAAAGVVLYIVRRWGIRQLTTATLVPIVASVIFLLGFHGKDLDLNYSARPLAREIHEQAPEVKTVAVEGVRRDLDYGLTFYRNQAIVHYCTDGVPAESHILVLRHSDTATFDRYLRGRVYKLMFNYDVQGVDVYRVEAR
ncbi:MAG: glycosyltransferase family 39 protein [Acidobacteriaceae bacterium]|nr:glycosyltransferase family 39 protein [Acidobacteriaceae bacterium]